MKIAITGGSGFIGTLLCKNLQKAGHECVIIDTRHEEPVDILDYPALVDALKGCEAIYHLAAEHRDDVFPRERYYDVNVKGSRNVASAADKNGITRVIFTSSFAVYGLDAGTPDETSGTGPFNDYGQSKLEAEEVLRYWAEKNENANLTIVRPVVVFGESNRGNVYTLIKQIVQNKFLMIGDGANRKSIAYVGNVAAFLQFLLERKESGEIYNYADKPDYSMKDFMAIIYDALGKARPAFTLPFPLGLGAGYTFDALSRVTGYRFPISAVRIRKFCADTTCAADKARRAGFVAPYTIEQGIARMIGHDFPQEKKAA